MLHAYTVRCGTLTVSILATGGCAAIARAMELYQRPFTCARRIA